MQEEQAAILERFHHRRCGGGVCGEAGALIVGDAEIAGGLAHQDVEAAQVLFRLGAGQQRLRAGIDVRIVIGFHRKLEQHFVAGGAGAVDPALQVVGVGHEGQRDFRRQLVDGGQRVFLRHAEAADDQRDARRAGRGDEGAGIGFGGRAAIRADLRQVASGGAFEIAGDRRTRQGGGRVDGVGRNLGDGHRGGAFAIAAVFGEGVAVFNAEARLASSMSIERFERRAVLQQRRRAVLFGIQGEFDAGSAGIIVAEKERRADSAGSECSERGDAQCELAETSAQNRPIGSP